jgi:hypothetical protein
MKLHPLDIPVETDQLANWIEQQLMSESFGSFVVQLQAIHDSSSANAVNRDPQFSSESLGQILGNGHQQIIEHGLGECSPEQIQQLLSSPNALLELQGQVYEAGSSYWFDSVVPIPDESGTETGADASQRLGELAAAIRLAVELPELNVEEARTRNAVHSGQSATPNELAGEAVITNRRTFNWNLLAMAAAVLIIGAVGFKLMSSPTTPTLAKWGWLSEDGIPTAGAPAEYLAKISAGGTAWFDKALTNSDDYIQRLRELNAGCQALIDADHSSLASADQQWLIGKCMEWRSSFEEQLESALEDPQGFQKYLNQTNQTVNSLVKALDRRSSSV